MNIKAIFFDFDGVIIDSEPVHTKAKKLVLNKFNIPHSPAIFNEFKGRPDKVFFEYVAENLDPNKRSAGFYLDIKNNLFTELAKKVKLVDGFLPFHKKARERGMLLVIVSSTSLHSFNLIDQIYHLSDLFDLIITGADTEQHKPHPEPYLQAFEKLSLRQDEAIVIEDAPMGIVSAKKAGCFVFGLTGTFSKAELKEAQADEVIDSYEELVRILKL